MIELKIGFVNLLSQFVTCGHLLTCVQVRTEVPYVESGKHQRCLVSTCFANTQLAVQQIKSLDAWYL